MILLTGATGFLGSAILKKLIDLNFDVVCVKRSTSSCNRVKNIYEKCKWYDIDLVEMKKVFIENEIDIVIHCATIYGRENHDFVNVYESNVILPLKIIECAEISKCKYFINTDTFYTKEVKQLWKTNQEFYMGDYVKSKYIIKNIVKDHIKSLSFSFINMQLEHIYGQQDGEKKFVNFIMKNLYNNVNSVDLSSGIQKRDWIYLDDVVSAYEIVLKNKHLFQKGCYYHFEVGTGKTTSLKEFVETLKKITGSSTKLMFGKCEMNRNELMSSCADNKDLLEIGWKPVYDIETGLKKLCEGYLNEKCYRGDTNL
ncbi:MAG: NAD-dependent epimerase/dehydratase family protein [Roseburia sp. 1XD42-69]